MGSVMLASWMLAMSCPKVVFAFSSGNNSFRLGRSISLSSSSASVEEFVEEASTSNIEKSRTQRIMEKTYTGGQTGGAGGSSTWDAFVRAESNWKRLKDSKAFHYDPKILDDSVSVPPKFVTDDGAEGNPKCWEKLRSLSEDNKELDYDVVICGGTLGIFFATALQMKGHNVCVMEAGKLQGREQEWNISMDEMMELLELGIFTQEDIDATVTTEFPGCRSGFKNEEVETSGSYQENGIGYELFTENVLNLGVSPSILLERVKEKFLSLGGVVKEQTPIKGVCISETIGAALDCVSGDIITSKLVLDCMGNASPISRQQRIGKKPDGVCCVVGSCAAGFDPETNTVGDLIYTNTPIQDKGENGKLQYFWEAFPVGIGRNNVETSDVKTTYMFTYMDADPARPSLEMLMEDYWNLLPMYQPSIKDPETDLDVKRVLFAYFPTYQDSPLPPQFSRLLATGDASGIQSPLSFGGFGALTRHLERITDALDQALTDNLLHKDDLGKINAYTPNLSAAWMFQKAMSVRVGQNVDNKFVNRLLATNFEQMEEMGIDTIKPFLQDVTRFDGLVSSLAGSFKADPFFMPEIIAHVGLPTLVNWLGHVSMMGLYTVNHALLSPILSTIVDNNLISDPRLKFQLRRSMDAWKFGSGSDYILPRDKAKKEMKV